MEEYKTIHFENIDSTNKYLKDNYETLDNLTFVSADYQSQGKGREDRLWTANKGENLLFSLLLKDEEIIKDGPFISLVAAVTIAVLLESYGLKKVKIKWPNDIYVNDKKIAGILLEGSLPHYLIVGIGININQKEFDGEYHKTPTSMYLELNEETDINVFKKDVYGTLMINLEHYSSAKEVFLRYFKKHDYLLNKKVSYIVNNETKSGRAKGIDENFNIIIRDWHGKHHISSGEINLIK